MRIHTFSVLLVLLAALVCTSSAANYAADDVCECSPEVFIGGVGRPDCVRGLFITELSLQAGVCDDLVCPDVESKPCVGRYGISVSFRDSCNMPSSILVQEPVFLDCGHGKNYSIKFDGELLLAFSMVCHPCWMAPWPTSVIEDEDKEIRPTDGGH